MNDSINDYANALHDCIEQVENLQWDKPADQKIIVKHLRGFIERVTPGQEHTLEQALYSINLSIRNVPTSHESYRLLSQMGRDITLLQAHFMNGSVLNKLHHSISILEWIWRFVFKRSETFDEQGTLAKCQTQLGVVTENVETRLHQLHADYCKKECHEMIGFLMRYNSEWVEERKQELDVATHLNPVERETEYERIHEVLKNEIDFHAEEILDLFDERYKAAPSHAFISHQIHDIHFLRHYLNRGGPIMAKAIVNKWNPKSKDKNLKKSAQHLLTTLENNIKKFVKDQEGPLLIERLKGIMEEKFTYASHLAKPHLKETLEGLEQKGNLKQHVPFLRSTLDEIKDKYVSRLQESIDKVRDIYFDADAQGIPLLEKWALELLRNDQFNRECADFAHRFIKEQDEFGKALLFREFLTHCLSQYKPHDEPGGSEFTELIGTIFMSIPSKGFLEACYDLNPNIIGFATSGPYTLEYSSGFNQNMNMFAVMQQALLLFFNPQRLPVIKLQFRLEQTQAIMKVLPKDAELVATQATLTNKLKAKKISKKDLETIETFILDHEQKVQNHLINTFERGRKHVMESLSPVERTLIYDLEKDASKLFTAMRKHKEDRKKLEQFAKDFAQLCVTYDVQDNNTKPFLRNLLLTQRGADVAPLIKKIHRDSIKNRIAPEPLSAAEKRDDTLKLLNNAVDTVTR